MALLENDTTDKLIRRVRANRDKRQRLAATHEACRQVAEVQTRRATELGTAEPGEPIPVVSNLSPCAGADSDHPEYSRKRAERMRMLAEGMSSQSVRRTIQQIAEGYERMAECAEATETGEPSSGSEPESRSD